MGVSRALEASRTRVQKSHAATIRLLGRVLGGRLGLGLLRGRAEGLDGRGPELAAGPVRGHVRAQGLVHGEDELEDGRPWAESVRQWSSFHPEFTFLPRKFKIAITGAAEDRAAVSCGDCLLDVVAEMYGCRAEEVLRDADGGPGPGRAGRADVFRACATERVET